MPSIKETQYFSDEKRFAKGIEWYMQWFRCHRNAVCGEVCPEYMFYEETPWRMRDVVPNPHLLFIFREPIDRAYSHYRMTKSRGYEDLGFAQALEVEKERLSGPNRCFAQTHYSYMARGRYADQVERFQRVFPDSKFLFLKFDEFIAPETKELVYARICRFLGIESVLDDDILDERSNVASRPKFTIVRDLLYGESALKYLLSPIVRSLLRGEALRLKVAMAVDKLNRSPYAKTVPDERAQTPARFRQAAREETEKLAALTGLDLNIWHRQTNEEHTEERS